MMTLIQNDNDPGRSPRRDNPPPKSGRFWPMLVVALLVGQFAVTGATIYLSQNDPHFAVEPDYYEKAIHWDDTARQRELNERLGWKYEVEVAPRPDAVGCRNVTLRLRDAQQKPIESAAVNVEMFHHAFAARRQNVSLTAAAPGVYGMNPEMRRSGVWELRFTVQRGDERFTFVESTYVP
ncbi:MAG: FixH family protein [Planctomycetes bacterium]|nr:FixH family protein [Planctomycetota bacterium]